MTKRACDKITLGLTQMKEVLQKMSDQGTPFDPVNHPLHYNSHPSGVQCITITEEMSYNIGTAMAYLWRHHLKENPIQDLEKAIWHIRREIGLLANWRTRAGIPAEKDPTPPISLHSEWQETLSHTSIEDAKPKRHYTRRSASLPHQPAKAKKPRAR